MSLEQEALDLDALMPIAKANKRPDHWPDPEVAREFAEKFPATFLDLVKTAYKQGWNDREDDLILGVERLGARQEGARGGEAVAWLVKDFADGRFATAEKVSADLYAQRGHHVQPLYASPAEPSGWRPIEEIEPKDGDSLIVATADNPPVVGEAWWREDYDGKLNLWWAGTGPGDYHADPIDQCNQRVTHGRPLPLPPTSEGGGA